MFLHTGVRDVHIGKIWDKGYTYKGNVMQNDKNPKTRKTCMKM